MYSPDLPESEASYAITAGGIADAKEQCTVDNITTSQWCDELMAIGSVLTVAFYRFTVNNVACLPSHDVFGVPTKKPGHLLLRTVQFRQQMQKQTQMHFLNFLNISRDEHYVYPASDVRRMT